MEVADVGVGGLAVNAMVAHGEGAAVGAGGEDARGSGQPLPPQQLPVVPVVPELRVERHAEELC